MSILRDHSIQKNWISTKRIRGKIVLYDFLRFGRPKTKGSKGEEIPSCKKIIIKKKRVNLFCPLETNNKIT